ncbi:DUF423 domain-containing protein [Marinobacterium rhizophilum]|uniref:DUF423 domain-containing protein n=1 Tax=Marinobacterium rhizophilum TaxID=420402 RepID=UPI000374F2C6|nr:DUF423 domain-containing protein [Marinobacterium rhizophilum]
MNTAINLRLVALSGFCAVALGAFGSHGLRERLTPHMLDVFETAVSYQFYHSLAWLAVVLLSVHRPSRWLHLSGICFGLGILLFCGSLYILALSGIHWLGAITPLGGLAFMAGWLLLGLATRQITFIKQ